MGVFLCLPAKADTRFTFAQKSADETLLYCIKKGCSNGNLFPYYKKWNQCNLLNRFKILCITVSLFPVAVAYQPPLIVGFADQGDDITFFGFAHDRLVRSGALAYIQPAFLGNQFYLVAPGNRCFHIQNHVVTLKLRIDPLVNLPQFVFHTGCRNNTL